MEELLTQLARQVREKYYGKYRGFVHDNRDPQHRGRVRLRVPSILADEVTGWALPCMPYGGLPGQGLFAIPDEEAQVWVEFEAGELSHPIWTGTFWQEAMETPAASDDPGAGGGDGAGGGGESGEGEPPTQRVLQTASRHRLVLDDEPGEERVILEHTSGAKLDLDPEGGVTLIDAQGAKVQLDAAGREVVIEDAHGNRIRMTSSGTTLEDVHGNLIEMGPGNLRLKGQVVILEGDLVALGGTGGEPVIKGASFLSKFASHVHPVPSLGTSGPPVPQGEISTLSKKVTTQ